MNRFAHVLRVAGSSLPAVATMALLAVALSGGDASAQIDSPPPRLEGEKAKHLWTVPGVQGPPLGTVFASTNTSSKSARVGVEVFDINGGSANDPSTTSREIAPSATVHFATGPVAALLFEVSLGIAPFAIDGGAARILATSVRIICSVYLVGDPDQDPLAGITALTIVKSTRQKGD